jgi:hypothetical protein
MIQKAASIRIKSTTVKAPMLKTTLKRKVSYTDTEDSDITEVRWRVRNMAMNDRE